MHFVTESKICHFLARDLFDFNNAEESLEITGWPVQHHTLRFPFAVLADRSHGSITHPDLKEPDSTRHAEIGALLRQALSCDWAEYQTLAEQWEVNYNQKTTRLADDPALIQKVFSQSTDAGYFEQFFMLNVHVIDDYGRDIPDYFLEFYGPKEDQSDEASIYFHREVLAHVHINQYNSSYRSLFINKNKLKGFYERIRTGDKVLNMSLSVKPPGSNISYFSDINQGAKGHLTIHRQDGSDIASQWLTANTTHFVELIIPRLAHLDVCKVNQFS